MTLAEQQIDRFLEIWAEEFTRAIQTLSGVIPIVSAIRAVSPSQTSFESSTLFWWKQSFEGAGSFTTWIAAEEPTWSALGNASGSNISDARNLYLAVICQAQQAAAAAGSEQLPKSLTCREGQPERPDSFDALIGFTIAIRLGDTDLSPILFFIEYTAGDMLLGPQRGKELQSIQKYQPEWPVSSPMLDRLMKLDLPLSVALGRAVMPIGDVLKITSGSMIQLDRTADDLVELIVHGTVVARGEVVSVKGNYGVRIKQIISKDDRLTLYDSH